MHEFEVLDELRSDEALTQHVVFAVTTSESPLDHREA